jgi:putative tricarboxylic transport membrane protein
MHNKRDMTAGLLLIAIGIAVIIWAIRLQVGTLLRPLPGFFPLLVGSGIVALSIILFIRGWRGGGKAPRPYGDWQRPAIMVAGLAVYALILAPVGYILSTIFIAMVTLRVLGLRSWKVIGLSSVVLSVTVYFVFSRLLDVELPAGVFSFLDRD